MSTNRSARIAELLAGLGVNQTLLLHLQRGDGFVRVDAVPDGLLRIRLSQGGEVDITFSRDRAGELVEALRLEDLLSTGLDYVVQDGAGRLLLEGQGAAFRETPDQVAEISEVPLAERVGRYLAQFDRNARSQSGSLTGGAWTLDYRGEEVDIEVFEQDQLIQLSVELPLPDERQRELAAERFPASASPLVLFFEGDEGRLLHGSIRLLGAPFIGQHLGRAVGELTKVIDIWKAISEEA